MFDWMEKYLYVFSKRFKVFILMNYSLLKIFKLICNCFFKVKTFNNDI